MVVHTLRLPKMDPDYCASQKICYLYIVNKSVRQFVASFLLLGILATLIPFNLFHHHHEDDHCDKTNAAVESDPCHITIYHGLSQEHHCEHNSHLTNVRDECEFCKFLITKRSQYTTNNHYQLIPIVDAQDLPAFEGFCLIRNSFNSTLGRAPPTC